MTSTTTHDQLVFQLVAYAQEQKVDIKSTRSSIDAIFGDDSPHPLSEDDREFIMDYYKIFYFVGQPNRLTMDRDTILKLFGIANNRRLFITFAQSYVAYVNPEYKKMCGDNTYSLTCNGLVQALQKCTKATACESLRKILLMRQLLLIRNLVADPKKLEEEKQKQQQLIKLTEDKKQADIEAMTIPKPIYLEADMIDSKIASLVADNKQMLTVAEFMPAMGMTLQNFATSKLLTSVDDRNINSLCVVLDDTLIRLLGFSGDMKDDARHNCTKLLVKSNEFTVDTDYRQITNEEYVNIYSVQSHGDSIPTRNQENDLHPQPRVSEIPAKECKELFSVQSRAESFPLKKRGDSQRIYYLVTPLCLKSLMMKVDTQQGKQIRAYYAYLEYVFRTYVRYQAEFKRSESDRIANERLQAADAKIQAAEEKAKLTYEEMARERLENEIKTRNHERLTTLLQQQAKRTTKSEYVYIISNQIYSGLHKFKIGKTWVLSSRVSTMNTTHLAGDKMYVCYRVAVYDAAMTEKFLHQLLHTNRIELEWFQFPFVYLKQIVDFVADESVQAVEFYYRMCDAWHNDIKAGVINDTMAPVPPFAEPEPEVKAITNEQILELHAEIDRLRDTDEAARFILGKIIDICAEHKKSLMDIMKPCPAEDRLHLPITIIEGTTKVQRKALGGLNNMRKVWNTLTGMLPGAA